MANKTRKQKKQSKQSQPWGYHLIIDAGNCDPIAIQSKETIAKFAKELVKAIKMVAFGPPRVVHFGSGKKMGYTLVQLIETSCIMAHFNDNTGSAYFDCFSCSTFDPKVVKEMFQKYFSPKSMKTRFLERQA